VGIDRHYLHNIGSTRAGGTSRFGCERLLAAPHNQQDQWFVIRWQPSAERQKAELVPGLMRLAFRQLLVTSCPVHSCRRDQPGSVAVSRSAMVAGPETSDVTNDQDPERRSERGAQTAALAAGHNADMRTLVRRLPVESASSGRNDARAGSVGRSFSRANGNTCIGPSIRPATLPARSSMRQSPIPGSSQIRRPHARSTKPSTPPQ